MRITIKGNDWGMGFYGDAKPLFYHKDGHCVISLLQEIVKLKPASVEYVGELSDKEMEADFA